MNNNRDSLLTLPTLKESVYQNYEKLAGPLREDFEEGQIERIFKVVCDMPTLEIELYVIGQLNDETDVLQRVKMPTTKNDWIQIHQNEVYFVITHVTKLNVACSLTPYVSLQEYTLQASFHRYVHRSVKDRQRSDQIIPKVHCPKFSKIKDEGWFLVLGDPNAAELIALKRCSYRNTKSIHPITFTAPNKIGKSFWHLLHIVLPYYGAFTLH